LGPATTDGGLLPDTSKLRDEHADTKAVTWTGTARLRALPIAALTTVALIGETGALWAPRATDMPDYWRSVVLLAIAMGLGAAAFRLPRLCRLPAVAAYVSSVAFLMLATGGVGSGLGSLLMLPVVVLALYGSLTESAITIASVVSVLGIISLLTPHLDATTTRRLIMFALITCVLSISIHSLRVRLAAANRELARRATEEERRRIARELHDGLAHELAFIASKARRPVGALASAPDSTQLADAADRALDEARRAITVLSATTPQSLSQAVTQTAEDLGERLGVPIHLQLDPSVVTPGHVTENLLRILREAMTNAARHGAPDHISIQLDRSHDLRMVVADDGRGFDRDEPTSGFGLISMRERASSIGAQLKVSSRPHGGTEVQVTLS